MHRYANTGCMKKVSLNFLKTYQSDSIATKLLSSTPTDVDKIPDMCAQSPLLHDPSTPNELYTAG